MTPRRIPPDASALPINQVELSIDRGYLNSTIVDDVERAGGEVLCKPWPTQNAKGLFTKRDFDIDARAGTTTCPAGEVAKFEPGETLKFCWFRKR